MWEIDEDIDTEMLPFKGLENGSIIYNVRRPGLDYNDVIDYFRKKSKYLCMDDYVTVDSIDPIKSVCETDDEGHVIRPDVPGRKLVCCLG